MSRVLLLTASFGEGHNQAALAVREALENKGSTVQLVDYIHWLHPLIRKFIKFGFSQGVKKAPSLYGLFYRSMSHVEPSSAMNRRLNRLGISHMKEFINSFRPDVVVGTFPAPMGVMSELRAAGFTNIPNASIITDYTAHRQWVHEHTDLYFAATPTVKRELVSYGVPAEIIEVNGIPVRSMFDEESAVMLLNHRKALRQKHRLDVNRLVILMMGGGEGLFASFSACQQIVTSVDAQFAIVCGHNERLYNRMVKFKSQHVRVFGYIDEVNEWMAISDLIITKPGGITVTEAFAMELPMLLFNLIPGQEERNALFAEQSGAAELASDLRTALKFLEFIVRNPSRLRSMRSAARLQAKRNSAERIAERLLELASKPVLENDVKP